MTADPAAPARRYAAIDHLKALAIVAVAVNHAGPFLMGPGVSKLEVAVRSGLTAFHVPTFLLLSGFLYHRAAPQSLRQVSQRLTRVASPYLVASVLALALGFSRWQTGWDALQHLALGSALGTYYYIFLLVLFIAAIFPLSRLPRAGVAGVLLLVCGWAVATTIDPGLGPRESFFWYARNPLHYIGYFLTGWVAAAWWPHLRALHTRWRWAVRLAAGAGIAVWIAAISGQLPNGIRPILRAVYTLSVVVLGASFTSRLRVPPIVRFLSETTLTLYLYHHMIEITLRSHVMFLPAPARIAALALAGLGGASALVIVGRRLLGERSRWWLGS